MIASTKAALLGLAALSVAVVPTAAAARDLTVVSWGGNYQDAQREIFFAPFAKQIGVPVLDESWDGGIGVIQARVRAGNPNWDVVQVEAEELALGCYDGLYETIDWSRIGNRSDFIPSAVSDCGVGAIVWSTAIAYDASVLAEGPKSWADFWDTEAFPGKRALRRGPKYTLEFALLADGVPVDQVYDVLSTPDGVDRAFAKLDEIKDDLVWWESGAQPLQLLATGEVVMAAAYNGRITGVNRSEGRNFVVVWPGSIFAVDSWVILKGSENVDRAHEFIAFASEPARMAQLPEYIAYGLPSIPAAGMVPEVFQSDLPTTPKNLEGALPLNVDFWIDNLEALNQRFNAWISQ